MIVGEVLVRVGKLIKKIIYLFLYSTSNHSRGGLSSVNHPKRQYHASSNTNVKKKKKINIHRKSKENTKGAVFLPQSPTSAVIINSNSRSWTHRKRP